MSKITHKKNHKSHFRFWQSPTVNCEVGPFSLLPGESFVGQWVRNEHKMIYYKRNLLIAAMIGATVVFAVICFTASPQSSNHLVECFKSIVHSVGW